MWKLTWIDLRLLLLTKFLLNLSSYENSLSNMLNSYVFKHVNVNTESIIEYVKHVTIKSCIEDVKYKKAFETLSKNHINLINVTSERLFLLVYKLHYEPLDKPIDKPVLNIHLKGLKESANNLEKFNKKFTNMEAFFKFSSPKTNDFYAAKIGKTNISTPNIFKIPANIKWMELNWYKPHNSDNILTPNVFKSPASISWIYSISKPHNATVMLDDLD